MFEFQLFYFVSFWVFLTLEDFKNAALSFLLKFKKYFEHHFSGATTQFDL